MCSSRLAVACVLALSAVACGKETATAPLGASVSGVEPACGDRAAATAVAIRGTLPVKVVASLSGSGSSTVDATYRAWLGDRALEGVAWVDAGTVAASVPAGLPEGDYAVTVETPFGERVTRERAFHVQAGACAPSAAALTTVVEVRPNTVTVGQQVAVTATITNGGLSAALAVRGTIHAPPGVSLDDASAGPADLAPGASTTFRWTYTATATTPSSGVTFDVEVAGTTPGGAPLTAPSARSSALLVNAAATLSASATAPAQARIGAPFVFSLMVANSGAAPALVTPDVQVAPTGAATVTQRPGARTVAGGAQQQFDFTITATTAGSLSLTGRVSGTDVNSGAALDVAPTAPLTVVVQANPTLAASVDGSGTVLCDGGPCQASYAFGTVVTLTAQAATGWTFTGWTGDCSGTGACRVTMDANRSVGATFAQQTFTLATPVTGSGSVACNGGACQASYAFGTVVTLTPQPATGWSFTGWTGDCSGSGACAVTLTTNRSVGATFARQTFPLATAVAPPGSGTVTCNGVACAAGYEFGTALTLVAQPSGPEWAFAGWTGDCTGTGTCALTMNAAHSVGATFTTAQYTLTVRLVPPGGPGTVTCNGSPCPAAQLHPYGTTVTLVATPDAGAVFGGWSDACAAAVGDTCTLTIQSDLTASASFHP